MASAEQLRVMRGAGGAQAALARVLAVCCCVPETDDDDYAFGDLGSGGSPPAVGTAGERKGRGRTQGAPGRAVCHLGGPEAPTPSQPGAPFCLAGVCRSERLL